jgi:hypothetical protein
MLFRHLSTDSELGRGAQNHRKLFSAQNSIRRVFLSERKLMTGSEIRLKRVAARISGIVLSARAGISNSRLSLIERGELQVSPDEIGRISAALDLLVAAKARIDAVAAEVGWPASGVAA